MAEGKLNDPAQPRAARRRRQRLYDQSWIVYAKRPFGGPQQVFRYLGHYTHRVAISNSRLLHLDDQTVVFRTRGHGRTACHPVEFIRRFLEHVLPPRFVKIRHFGLFAAVHGRHTGRRWPYLPAPAPHLRHALDHSRELALAALRVHRWRGALRIGNAEEIED